MHVYLCNFYLKTSVSPPAWNHSNLNTTTQMNFIYPQNYTVGKFFRLILLFPFRDFFVKLGGAEGLLLVQCDNGETNFNLIACCRYIVDGIRRDAVENFKSSGKPIKPIHIVFIVQLPKIAGGCEHFVGFQSGKWQSVHIDELLKSSGQLPRIQQLVNRSVSDLFKSKNIRRDDSIGLMDVDEDVDETQDMDIDVDDLSKISEQLVEVNNCQW